MSLLVFDEALNKRVCPLCKKPSDDWHNGAPVVDAQVCTDCNENIVIPARLREALERDTI